MPVPVLLAQFNVPSPGHPSDALGRWVAIFFVLMGLGFIFGVAGHVIKSRTLVAIGVALIMVSTAIFLIAVARQG